MQNKDEKIKTLTAENRRLRELNRKLKEEITVQSQNNQTPNQQ